MVCPICKEDLELVEVIGEEEIIRVCEKCAIKEHLPIITKPSTFQLKDSEKSYTVRERLSRISGQVEKKITLDSLRLQGPKNLDSAQKHQFLTKDKPRITEEEQKRLDLIDNFNWYIKRARMKRGMMIRELAKAIGETEIVIKMIENANLPSDANRLISKIEQFLSINLRKGQISKVQEKAPLRVLNFDKDSLKTITISDLKKMKEEKEKTEKLAWNDQEYKNKEAEDSEPEEEY